jgi:hypothetical protein
MPTYYSSCIFPPLFFTLFIYIFTVFQFLFPFIFPPLFAVFQSLPLFLVFLDERTCCTVFPKVKVYQLWKEMAYRTVLNFPGCRLIFLYKRVNTQRCVISMIYFNRVEFHCRVTSADVFSNRHLVCTASMLNTGTDV